jgi:hypothetical protein
MIDGALLDMREVGLGGSLGSSPTLVVVSWVGGAVGAAPRGDEGAAPVGTADRARGDVTSLLGTGAEKVGGAMSSVSGLLASCSMLVGHSRTDVFCLESILNIGRYVYSENGQGGLSEGI